MAFISSPRLTAVGVRLIVLAIQLKEADRRWILDFEMMVRGNQPQRVIDMRQMIDSDVADEGAFDIGIAQAPMQPAKENAKLSEQREGHDQPVRIHAREPQTNVAART